MPYLRLHWLELALGLAGIFIIVRSLRGAIVREFTSYGRGGRSRTYVGADAVREGIFQAVVGLTIVLFAAYLLFMTMQ